MKWEQLDKQKLTAFIDSVKTSGEAVLFNPISSEGKFTTLPFYKTIMLYRLSNFASIPMFSLHYLSDGQRFFYLDGTEVPLITVNHTGALNLTPSNVIAYLNFYFFAVQRPEGEVFLVQDPETYPFQDSQGFDVGNTISIGHNTPSYEIIEESDGGLSVDTPLFMDGTLVRAQLRVDPQGRVHILSQRMMVTEQTGYAQPYQDESF